METVRALPTSFRPSLIPASVHHNRSSVISLMITESDVISSTYTTYDTNPFKSCAILMSRNLSHRWEINARMALVRSRKSNRVKEISPFAHGCGEPKMENTPSGLKYTLVDALKGTSLPETRREAWIFEKTSPKCANGPNFGGNASQHASVLNPECFYPSLVTLALSVLSL